MHFQCELVRLVSAVAVVVRPAAQNFHTDVRFDKRQLDLAPPVPRVVGQKNPAVAAHGHAYVHWLILMRMRSI